MVPYIIGGIALAATGYGVKKFLEDDDNQDKITDTLMRGYEKIDEFEQKGYKFFDDLEKKVDEYFGPDEEQHQSKSDNHYILPELQEYVEKFEEATSKLYNSSLVDLQTAFHEIKNLKRDLHLPSLSSTGRKYNFASMSDDIKASFESYTATLLNIKEHIDVELDKLDEILLKSNDYNSYSDEEKAFVQELINIQTTIDKVTQSKMTFDRENFTREVKRAFKKLDSFYNNKDKGLKCN